MNGEACGLMADIMDGITSSDAWAKAQTNDPLIMRANGLWDEALARVKSLLPRDLYMELADAEASKVAAYGDAGIMFGLRVADTIRTISSAPSDLSNFLLARIQGEDG